jgi:hypothetical protein
MQRQFEQTSDRVSAQNPCKLDNFPCIQPLIFNRRVNFLCSIFILLLVSYPCSCCYGSTLRLKSGLELFISTSFSPVHKEFRVHLKEFSS